MINSDYTKSHTLEPKFVSWLQRQANFSFHPATLDQVLREQSKGKNGLLYWIADRPYISNKVVK